MKNQTIIFQKKNLFFSFWEKCSAFFIFKMNLRASFFKGGTDINI